MHQRCRHATYQSIIQVYRRLLQVRDMRPLSRRRLKTMTRLVAVQLEPGGPNLLAEVLSGDLASDDADAFARASDELEGSARSVTDALDTMILPTARVITDRF